MLGSYTLLEILLASAVFLLAGAELWGVIRARREGRSRNVSRVASHVTMLLLLVAYVAFAWSYLPLEASTSAIEEFNTPIFNWNFLIPGILLTMLAIWETLSVYRARRAGHVVSDAEVHPLPRRVSGVANNRRNDVRLLALLLAEPPGTH